jgi:deoxyhypusine synthase
MAFAARELNKNSTKQDVIKLASKMGYSSSEVAEAYDYIKDELNSYNSGNSSTSRRRSSSHLQRKKKRKS